MTWKSGGNWRQRKEVIDENSEVGVIMRIRGDKGIEVREEKQ